MKKISFVSYGGGHVNALLPIYEKLLPSKVYACNYLALTTAYKVLNDRNLPCIGFKDLVGERNYAVEVGKKLIGEEYNRSMVSYEESIAYMGLSYCDLSDQVGEKKARELYARFGRQAFYPLNTLKRFLSKEAPDLVITTNSPRAERAAVDAAKDLGIPSLCLVDLFALQEISWIGKPGFANKVCVISDHVKDHIVAAGRRSDEVVVTGNPAFDQLAYLTVPASLGPKKTTILWASQVEPEQHPMSADIYGDPELPVRIERKICEIARKMPYAHFILRHHPSEKRNYVVEHTEQKNIEISKPSSSSLHEQLISADIVVTMTSTVALEAALLSKHVVTVDLSIFSNDAPFSAMGISNGVTSLDELESTLFKLANTKPKKRQGLPEVGNATNNILSEIKEIIGV